MKNLFISLILVAGCDMQIGTTTGEEPLKTPGTNESATPTVSTSVASEVPQVAVFRLTASGSLDGTYGTSGIYKFPNEGWNKPLLVSATLDSQNRLVLFGDVTPKDRLDVDRMVTRVLPTGALDTSFGTDGYSTLNLSQLNDRAKYGMVLPDGKILATGYTSMPTGVGAQAANRIVLSRLNDDGKLDARFGYQGVSTVAPFTSSNPATEPWGMAEAYAAVYQQGKYVTTGYGRTAATGTVDVVSFRFLEDGSLDTTFGVNGAAVFDLDGQNDRGRHLSMLPDGRLLIAGSVSPTASNVDGLLMMLTNDGALDRTFSADGYRKYDFGRTDEALFMSAVSPSGNYIAAVGYRAGGNEDDDAILVIRKTDGSFEFAQAVPLSETGNDRFWGLAFGADEKLYATGFVTEGSDAVTAVVRFNLDGTRDLTFGTNGLVKLNLITGGAVEHGRSVAVSADGSVYVAGVAEAAVANP